MRVQAGKMMDKNRQQTDMDDNRQPTTENNGNSDNITDNRDPKIRYRGKLIAAAILFALALFIIIVSVLSHGYEFISIACFFIVAGATILLFRLTNSYCCAITIAGASIRTIKLTTKSKIKLAARIVGTVAVAAAALGVLGAFDYLQQLTQIDNLIGALPVSFAVMFAVAAIALIWIKHPQHRARFDSTRCGNSSFSRPVPELPVRQLVDKLLPTLP